MDKYKCLICKTENRQNYNVGLILNTVLNHILCIKCYNKGYEKQARAKSYKLTQKHYN